MGVPPKSSIYRWIFPEINHPSIKGYPHDYGIDGSLHMVWNWDRHGHDSWKRCEFGSYRQHLGFLVGLTQKFLWVAEIWGYIPSKKMRNWSKFFESGVVLYDLWIQWKGDLPKQQDSFNQSWAGLARHVSGPSFGWQFQSCFTSTKRDDDSQWLFCLSRFQGGFKLSQPVPKKLGNLKLHRIFGMVLEGSPGACGKTNIQPICFHKWMANDSPFLFLIAVVLPNEVPIFLVLNPPWLKLIGEFPLLLVIEPLSVLVPDLRPPI